MDITRMPLSITNQAAILVVSFSIFLGFLVVSLTYQNPQSKHGSAETRVLKNENENEIGGEDSSSPHHGSSKFVDNHSSSESLAKHSDKLLDGILSPRFDEQSCLSRYQAAFYRNTSPHKPSSYLISRLRKYEALHKKCGPYTESYNKTIEKLESGPYIDRHADCNYVVWIPYSGLGNKILSLASTFLYALLTNKVLLVDRGSYMADLFCEPFPETSWFLPHDFPINKFDSLGVESPQCYGNMIRNNLINGSISSVPPFLYLHLAYDYNKDDKLFFCEEDQIFMQKVPWLIIRTNYYFVPSLFLISSLEQELSLLFPLKETVFHHLGRYLIHPTNMVWTSVKRYYEAYLAKADERLGIQIRIFESTPGPFPYSLEQIRGCYLKEKLLPEVSNQEPISPYFENRKSKAVLVTSLNSTYFASLRDTYWEHPTVTGEIIGIYQPSNEQLQQNERLVHNRKALAEICLLSMTDILITSGRSTFGYIAQGLGGLKPWILTKPKNSSVPIPHCQRAISIEPCFHLPPHYDCKLKIERDDSKVIPQVKRCEDADWGVKLVDNDL